MDLSYYQLSNTDNTYLTNKHDKYFRCLIKNFKAENLKFYEDYLPNKLCC